MVLKEFCDVCGREMPIPRNPEWHDTRASGQFSNRGKEYYACQICADAIERCIKELKEKHRLLERFKENPNSIKGQRELEDFE